MGRTKVSTQGAPAVDIKKFLGVPFQGVYTGSKEIKTDMGAQTIYAFKGKTKPFEVFGFTNLNNSLKNVTVGDTITMTYTGQTKGVKTRFGLKDVHQVDVEKWDGQGEQFDAAEVTHDTPPQSADDIPF